MIRTKPAIQPTMVRTTVPGKVAAEQITAANDSNGHALSVAEVRQFLKNPPMIKLPNELTVPTPFFIHSDRCGKLGFHSRPVKIHYGKVTVEMKGAKLVTRDEDILLAIAKLARAYERLDFTTTVNEIVRASGRQVARDTQQKVIKSLNRLQTAQMTIWIADEESYHFVFLPEFYINRANGTVAVNLHHKLQRMFFNRMVRFEPKGKWVVRRFLHVLRHGQYSHRQREWT